MSRAALDLRRRVMAALGQSGELAVALGGPGRILDRAPALAAPFILFGTLEVRDYSTATEAGEEHLLALDIWTAADQPAKAMELAALVREALSPLAPDYLSTRSRRVAASRLLVTTLTMRWVTET